jgi:hypothetical protein
MRLFRLRIIQDAHIRFSDAPTAQDFEFNLRFMFACDKVVYSNIETYYNYVRDQPTSVTNVFRPQYVAGYEHVACVVLEYERKAYPWVFLRAFRCYELYTSCRKKIFRAALSPTKRSELLELAERRLAPLAPPWPGALLILLTMRGGSWRYRAKKLGSVFLDPLVLSLRYRFHRVRLRMTR